MLNDLVSCTDKELAYGSTYQGNSCDCQGLLFLKTGIMRERIHGSAPDRTQNINFYAFITEYQGFQVDFSQKI